MLRSGGASELRPAGRPGAPQPPEVGNRVEPNSIGQKRLTTRGTKNTTNRAFRAGRGKTILSRLTEQQGQRQDDDDDDRAESEQNAEVSHDLIPPGEIVTVEGREG